MINTKKIINDDIAHIFAHVLRHNVYIRCHTQRFCIRCIHKNNHPRLYWHKTIKYFDLKCVNENFSICYATHDVKLNEKAHTQFGLMMLICSSACANHIYSGNGSIFIECDSIRAWIYALIRSIYEMHKIISIRRSTQFTYLHLEIILISQFVITWVIIGFYWSIGSSAEYLIVFKSH